MTHQLQQLSSPTSLIRGVWKLRPGKVIATTWKNRSSLQSLSSIIIKSLTKIFTVLHACSFQILVKKRRVLIFRTWKTKTAYEINNSKVESEMLSQSVISSMIVHPEILIYIYPLPRTPTAISKSYTFYIQDYITHIDCDEMPDLFINEDIYSFPSFFVQILVKTEGSSFSTS